MARSAWATLEAEGRRPISGVVVSPEPASDLDPALAVHTGSHPVPDERSERAGRAVLAEVGRSEPDEVLLVLLSGGASSLLSTPVAGVSLHELATATSVLLRAGAPIELLNAVRRHTVEVSGGRLARAARSGAIRVLAVSDVAGDDPAVLASGPFAADPTSHADALAGIDGLGIRSELPEAVRIHLEAGARGEREESVGPGDPSLERVSTEVIASLADALSGAADAARGLGLVVVRHESELTGEAREVGRDVASRLIALRDGAPTLWVAGGETTVTVQGEGRGGRSQELALAAAQTLEGVGGVSLLAAGTDGIDGPTDAAGAHADAGTVERGRAAGRSAAEDLARNDAYGFFEAEGGLFRPGPTGTNVRDLVLAHVARS